MMTDNNNTQYIVWHDDVPLDEITILQQGEISIEGNS